jgi:organic radical activating enzyme
MFGPAHAKRLAKKYDCNIPWAILLDPTSACNLKCKGCWAAEYDKTDTMEFALLDRIIREGKEMGIYLYLYSGGEPTLRKTDLLRLAAAHDDCMFLAFTNRTLVDREFSQALADVGISLHSVSKVSKSGLTPAGTGTNQKLSREQPWEGGCFPSVQRLLSRKRIQNLWYEKILDSLSERMYVWMDFFLYPLARRRFLT